MVNDHGVVNTKYPEQNVSNNVEIKGRDFLKKDHPTLRQVLSVLSPEYYVEIDNCRSVRSKGKISDILKTFVNLYSANEAREFRNLLDIKVRYVIPCVDKDCVHAVHTNHMYYQIQLMPTEDDGNE